jgi:hypothetical protein
MFGHFGGLGRPSCRVLVAPVALPDSFSVTAGAGQVVLDLVADNGAGPDSFEGDKADLLFDFDTTGTIGTGIAKNAAGNVTYTAPGVAGNDGFLYRITDSFGTSNFTQVSIAIQAAVDDYAALVQSLGGSGPISYWRMHDPFAGIVDEEAVSRDGTYDVPPIAATGLPIESDGATKFTGTQAGTIPHDAGLLLPALTLSVWFSVADPNRSTNILVSKDNTGFDNGDFGLLVLAGGLLRASFQVADESHLIEVSGIEADTPYHAVVTADSSGHELWLNGKFVGASIGHTAGWANNDNPIQFASVFWTGLRLIGSLDEIALFSSVLSDANIISLSQVTADPVAVDDTGSLDESTATTLGTVDKCTFVGRKDDLTVEVWDGDSWETSAATAHGTASVNASNDLVFTAGSVASTEIDTFDYRITDLNGTSNTGTVSVTIANASVEEEPIAQCFVLTDPTVDVNTTGEFTAGITAANGGGPRIIRVEPGTYTWNLTFAPAGSEASPIRIVPRDGFGSVTFNNSQWNVNGTRCVVQGFLWNNASVRLDGGSFNRISRNKFQAIDRAAVQINGGTDLRINHNEFTGYVSTSLNNKNCIYITTGGITSGATKRILIDYNYMHDCFQEADGLDRLDLIWTSTGGAWDSFPEIIIDHCLFHNSERANAAEVIVIKTSGVKVRFCTFTNLPRDYLQQRQGSGWEVRSCWFEGCASNPLKCWDDNAVPGVSPLVIGNRVVGSGMWIGSGTATTGGPNSDNGGRGYHASIGGRYIGNRVDGQIVVGQMWSNDVDVVPAQNNNLYQNTGTEVIENATGTTHNVDNEPYVAAVKLTSSDVGLNAADPLCD